MSRRRPTVLVAAVVGALLAPATASAATVEVHDGTLRYTGAGAAESRVNFDETGPGQVRVVRFANNGDTDPIVLGAGCAATATINEYACDGVARAHLDLGDGLDGVGAYGLTSIPVLIEGGAGDDYLAGGRVSDVLRGGAGADYLYAADGGNEVDGGDGDDEIFSDVGTDVLRGGRGFDSVEFSRTEDPAPLFVITLDGAANDGVAGENDLVAADIEDVFAGSADYAGLGGRITLTGDARTNVLRVDYGSAAINGGGGNDLITGGPHDDVIEARDGFADRVSCGDGADTARVDAVDSVDASCETTDVRPTEEPPAPVDDAPPVVALSVVPSVTVGHQASISATASDDRRVAKVQFLLGGRLLCEDTTAPFGCDFVPRADEAGTRTALAFAFDERQQTAVALTQIDVRNDDSPPPAPVQFASAPLTFAPGATNVGVPVTCTTRGTARCVGSLVIDANVARRSAKDRKGASAARRARRVVLARASFAMAAGRSTTVKAKLSRRGVRRAIGSTNADRRTIKARMTVTLRNAAGERTVVRQDTRITVRRRSR